jgi:tRNA pseudouridine38-40 synthase
VPTEAGPRHLAFTVEYDGSRWFGFQYQPREATVQGELYRVFRKLLQDRFTMRAAGRTDRGVHALGMVISIRSEAAFQWNRILDLANDRLSPYVRLLDVRPKDWDFHPRFAALLRHYRYVLCEDRSLRGPVMHGYTTFVPGKLDWDAVAEAAARLEGERNFTAFCTRPIDHPRLVRRIDRIRLSQQGSFRFLDFHGRSFLRGQIRNIMGWLIQVGLGRFPPGKIDELLAKQVKDVAVRPAPPEGLYLVRIWYPGDPLPDWYTPPATPPGEPLDDDED